jgi:hypothetical protein
MRQTPIPADLTDMLWHVLTVDPQRQLRAETEADRDAGVATVCPVRWRKAFVRQQNRNPDARTKAKAAPPIARAELVGYLIIGVDRQHTIPMDLLQKVDGIRAIMCRAGMAAVIPPYMVRPMLELPDQWTPPAPDTDKPAIVQVKVGEYLAPIRGLLKGQSVRVVEVSDRKARVEMGEGSHAPMWLNKVDLKEAG